MTNPDKDDSFMRANRNYHPEVADFPLDYDTQPDVVNNILFSEDHSMIHTDGHNRTFSNRNCSNLLGYEENMVLPEKTVTFGCVDLGRADSELLMGGARRKPPVGKLNSMKHMGGKSLYTGGVRGGGIVRMRSDVGAGDLRKIKLERDTIPEKKRLSEYDCLAGLGGRMPGFEVAKKKAGLGPAKGNFVKKGEDFVLRTHGVTGPKDQSRLMTKLGGKK